MFELSKNNIRDTKMPQNAHHSRSLSLPQMDLLQVAEASDTFQQDQEHLLQQEDNENNKQSDAKSFFWFTNADLAIDGYRSVDKNSDALHHSPTAMMNQPRPPQFSMLHAAAITGDKSALQKLLAGNFGDIDLRDKFGRTPLMFACLGDYPECAEVLLRGGSRAALADRSGRNAAHWAAHHGHANCLKALLSWKKNPVSWTAQDQGGVTILHLATRHPEKKCLPLIFKHFTIGAGEVDIQDRNKRTALHWSCSQGCHEYAKLLLKRGSRPDSPDVEGKTPLHWAASSAGAVAARAKLKNLSSVKGSDPTKTVKLMVEAAPNALNWQDYEGRLPIHLAVADSDASVVKALLKSPKCQIDAVDGNRRSPLHWACLLGKSDLCSLLLEHGAAYPTRDSEGATPLHYAVASGCEDTLAVMAKRKEVSDLPDVRGRSALMWSAADANSSPEMLSILTSHAGSDPRRRDEDGRVAMHLAVVGGADGGSGNIEGLRRLIEMDAGCAEMRDADGRSPLMLAAEMGRKDEVLLLLNTLNDDDAEPRADPSGILKESLHLAAESGRAVVVEMLLERERETRGGGGGKKLANSVDVYGRTPLMKAAFGGYVDCMTVLIERGASVSQRDNECFCALHWSVLRGHLDAVRLLVGRGASVNVVALKDQGRGQALKQITPLDSAVSSQHEEIVSELVRSGALTLGGLVELAATKIQAWFRGAKIRRSFNRHRALILRHEKLRAKKAGREFGHRVGGARRKATGSSSKNSSSTKASNSSSSGKNKSREQGGRRNLNGGSEDVVSDPPASIAGDFLGLVVERSHRKSAMMSRDKTPPSRSRAEKPSRCRDEEEEEDFGDFQKGNHHHHQRSRGKEGSHRKRAAGLRKSKSLQADDKLDPPSSSSPLNELSLSSLTGRRIGLDAVNSTASSSSSSLASSREVTARVRQEDRRSGSVGTPVRRRDKGYSYNLAGSAASSPPATAFGDSS